MINTLRLGVSGEAGSFSEEAGLLYAKNQQLNVVIDYLVDMEGVLAAIEKGTVEIGIFPVMNLNGGLVRMAFKAMGHYQFEVIDELWLTVHQCLLVKQSIAVEQIKKIISHSQAIAQCKNYLTQHFKNAELIEYQDTAKAAKDLAQGILPPLTAVIAPEKAAAMYNLKVIKKNIQDKNPNLTAFIIVKKVGAI